MFALKMIMTYKCNSMCDHCRFRSGPNLGGGITPPEKAKEWVKALRDSFDLERLVLYGGEPTLCSKEMCDIAEFAHSIGVSIHVETNCSWAITVERAVRFLSRLKGLNPQFLFSFDGFHARFIPFDRVRNAIVAAKKLGITHYHDIALMDNIDAENDYDKSTKSLMTELEEEGNLGNYALYRTFYTGRAAEKLARRFSGKTSTSPHLYRDFLPGFRGLDQKCVKLPWYLDMSHENTNVLVVDPYAWVSFGCGIAIGNAKDVSMTDIIDSYSPSDHPIIGVLVKEGPVGLARLPEAEGYPMKTRYVEKCHLCQDIRNYLKPYFPNILVPPNMYF